MVIEYVGINKIPYALHRHNNWEILYYTQGEGYLATEKNNFPFKQGTIMIIPPKTPHGTVFKKGAVNISLGSDFDSLLMFNSVVSLFDTPSNDAEALIKLIFANRYSSSDYLSSLCKAYVQFILENIRPKNHITQSINAIISRITNSFYDNAFDVTKLLNQSGYAEDYIRSQFKLQTGVTPTAYLTKIRIDHSKKIFDIYGDSVSVAEAAYACGFDDPVYFSKRFKQIIGTSPDRYKKNITTTSYSL